MIWNRNKEEAKGICLEEELDNDEFFMAKEIRRNVKSEYLSAYGKAKMKLCQISLLAFA